MNGLNLDDSFYEWIYGYDLADMDKITEKLSPKEKAKKKILGSDVGLSCDWKVPIKNEWEPWYPTIVEGSYVIISYYVEEKKKMFFSAKFTFDKVGVFAGLGVRYVGTQLGDGTYLMDWFFKVYSHKYDPKRELPLCFEPVFILNSDKREIIHKGSAYKLIVCADRRVYDGADYLSDPGEWYKFTPANTVTDPDKKTFLNADGDRVVVQMKRMEKIGDL